MILSPVCIPALFHALPTMWDLPQSNMMLSVKNKKATWIRWSNMVFCICAPSIGKNVELFV